MPFRRPQANNERTTSKKKKTTKGGKTMITLRQHKIQIAAMIDRLSEKGCEYISENKGLDSKLTN